MHTDQREDNGRRRLVADVLVPVFIGLMGVAGLLSAAGDPRLEAYRAVDVVRLVAAGGCLGAALTALAMHFVGRRRG